VYPPSGSGRKVHTYCASIVLIASLFMALI
jgi:hypothetical protein